MNIPYIPVKTQLAAFTTRAFPTRRSESIIFPSIFDDPTRGTDYKL